MSYAGRQDGGGFLVKSKIKEQKLKLWYSAERDIFLLKKRPLGRYVDFNFITLNLYIFPFPFSLLNRFIAAAMSLVSASSMADTVSPIAWRSFTVPVKLIFFKTYASAGTFRGVFDWMPIRKRVNSWLPMAAMIDWTPRWPAADAPTETRMLPSGRSRSSWSTQRSAGVSR